MALLAGGMIWEFQYRRSKMEKIFRRIRPVYTVANTVLPALSITKKVLGRSRSPPEHHNAYRAIPLFPSIDCSISSLYLELTYERRPMMFLA